MDDFSLIESVYEKMKFLKSVQLRLAEMGQNYVDYEVLLKCLDIADKVICKRCRGHNYIHIENITKVKCAVCNGLGLVPFDPKVDLVNSIQES